MIKKIKKIKNFGVFNDYQISADLLDFKKYNLIYGWNASGKTTLSRLLRCFELKTIHSDFLQAEFQLQMENGSLSNHESLDKISNIRVFNKDFIDENVFTQENTAQPIYYLGKEDIEQKKKLESLKNIDEELKKQLSAESESLEKKKRKNESFITEKAKQIKIFLRTEGTDIYTNYDKSHLCKNIEILNEEVIQSSVLNEEELGKKQEAIRQAVKEKIALLEEQILFNEEDIEQINKILRTDIISETIEKLKDNKTLNKWVQEGLNLYNQSNEGNCHFCEQKMPEKRLKVLKRHFNKDYENLLSKIKNLEQNWKSKEIEIFTPNKNSLYNDLSVSFEKEKEKLNETIKKYNQFINKILEQLEKKKENPFQSIEDICYEVFQIKDLVKEVNKIISSHNEKTDNFKETRLKDKQSIEKHLLSESYTEYHSLKEEIIKMKKSIEKLKTENSKINQEIEQLSLKRRDYKRIVQIINKKLKSFLGREELIFEVTNTKDEGYYIKRASNGSHAHSLSEGEKTAVALVYFLSKLGEDNFDLNNGIVVIDDPISSLDSNSVFQAFGFIRAEIKKAKQIFILTHGFDFFKHVKHWFNRDCKEKAEFFMIKNFLEKNKRIAKLNPLDDLLRKYDSEYQYLFSLLYKLKDESDTLEEIYPFPNMARKFMETFLSFKFPSGKNHDEVFSKARKKTNFENEKIEKIKRFLNAHSHLDIDKMQRWDTSQWSEGKQIIRDILNLVEGLDEEHYKGLFKILKDGEIH